jgi:hypothetical protein
MSTEDIAAQPVRPAPPAAAAPRKRRRWLHIAGLAVAFIVVLIIGVVAGAQGNQPQINQLHGSVRIYQHNLADASGKLAAARSEITTLKGQVAIAQNQAAHAVAIAAAKADAAAKAAYASKMAAAGAKMAAANAAYANATSEQRQLNQEIGNVEASAISQDGVYVVGHDIKAGTWHTNGDNGVGGNACYFATLNSTNTSDIADNNNFDGPETVNLNGAYAFEISGPCQWVRISS